MQKAKHLHVVGKRARKYPGLFRNKYYHNYFALLKDRGHRTLIPEQHIF